jgi:putative flavoprotein involved in K+ transport
MTQNVDTIVVGGGQAGLSASWHLKQAGRDHLVLDRGQIGDTWRNRWDSFCLVSPNRLCQLPGFPYDGDDPDGFMLRDQIVDYVERFASSFGPPYRGAVEIERVGASGGAGRFELVTSKGDFTADNLVIAVGTHQHPNIPRWDRNLPAEITKLHTRDYRNAGQLPDGAVQVVGSGQSGCQVAEDLHGAGREVHLCVGNAGRIPRRYRGRDIFEWDIVTGYFDLMVDDHPMGRDIRFKPHPHLSGRDGGHTIDLRQLALNGIRLHGKVMDVEGSAIRFSGDLSETLDRIDRGCRAEMDGIDSFVAEHGLDAPEADIVPVDWEPEPEPPLFDLKKAGIGSVIYATGFHYDFNWIDLPIFDGRGYPRYERGVTKIPGLYFVGLHWMLTQGSGLFYQVGRDAGFVVDHLCNQGR